jgi:hypothetical protein
MFSESQNPESWDRCEGRKLQKSTNPNFFARNALIFPVSAKKKFGKICKAMQPTIENKGNFLARLARNLQKPRHPRVLQGSDRRAGDAACIGYAA